MAKSFQRGQLSSLIGRKITDIKFEEHGRSEWLRFSVDGVEAFTVHRDRIFDTDGFFYNFDDIKDRSAK